MAGEARQKRILTVDDEPRNLRLVATILEGQGYQHDEVSDGRMGLERVKAFKPDLVYLDVMMPGMDGFEVCRELKSDPATRHVPVVMITSLADRDSKLRGLEAGADDFLTKPFDGTELMMRTRNLLRVKEFEDFLEEHNRVLEEDVRKRTEELRVALQELAVSRDRLNQGYVDTVHRLTKAAEFKDEDTAAHIKRVGHYSTRMAMAMGLSAEAVECIFYAAPMHDIGKIGIPSDILLKPGRLTPEEFALVKTHTTIGGRILGESVSEYIRMAERIALTHHERWDGSGYPMGLSGEDIPVEGRIMNVVDQYDSLRSRRPYKPGLAHEAAVKVIAEGDGRTMPHHFDPEVLGLFKSLHGEFEEIFEKHKD
jgi:putative two-component system response regulator